MRHLFWWTAGSRNVRLLWAGRTASFLGEQVAEIALIFFTWELTKSSTAVGLIVFVSRAPFWAIGWIAGAYADRFPRKQIIIWSNITGCLICFLISASYFHHALTVGALAVLGFLFSLSRAIELPAVAAVLPELVTRSDIGKINLVVDNTKRIGRLVGPALASLLQRAIAVPYLYLIAGLSLLIMAINARSLEVRSDGVMSLERKTTLIHELKVGWRVLASDPRLFSLIICFSLYCPVYAIGYYVVLPRFISVELGGDGSLYSMAVAAFSGGALASNIVLGSVSISNKSRASLLGFLWVGLGFALLAAVRTAWAALVCLAITAAGIPLMDIGVATIINERIPRAHQGKVFSLFRYFAEIGLAVGVLIGGRLVDTVGSRVAVVMLGIYIVPLVFLFFCRLRKLEMENTVAGTT